MKIIFEIFGAEEDFDFLCFGDKLFLGFSKIHQQHNDSRNSVHNIWGFTNGGMFFFFNKSIYGNSTTIWRETSLDT